MDPLRGRKEMMKKPKVEPFVAKLERNIRKIQKMKEKMNFGGQSRRRVPGSSSDDDLDGEQQKMEDDDHISNISMLSDQSTDNSERNYELLNTLLRQQY